MCVWWRWRWWGVHTQTVLYWPLMHFFSVCRGRGGRQEKLAYAEGEREREPNECECIDFYKSESAAEPDAAGMLLLSEFTGR